MTDTTQAVVDEADTKPVAGSEAESARTTTEPSLDELLASYDEQTKPVAQVSPNPQPQPQPQPQPSYDPRLEQEISTIKDRLSREDINKAIEIVGAGTNAPRRIVKGYLEELAREDPRLAKAWNNRDADPKGWDRILKSAAKEFSKELRSSVVDEAATEDKAAVMHAMRGASNRQPEEQPTDLSRLSTHDFRKEVREKYGYDPGV